jgi:hypothetical protein
MYKYINTHTDIYIYIYVYIHVYILYSSYLFYTCIHVSYMHIWKYLCVQVYMYVRIYCSNVQGSFAGKGLFCGNSNLIWKYLLETSALGQSNIAEMYFCTLANIHIWYPWILADVHNILRTYQASWQMYTKYCSCAEISQMYTTYCSCTKIQ